MGKCSTCNKNSLNNLNATSGEILLISNLEIKEVEADGIIRYDIINYVNTDYSKYSSVIGLIEVKNSGVYTISLSVNVTNKNLEPTVLGISIRSLPKGIIAQFKSIKAIGYNESTTITGTAVLELPLENMNLGIYADATDIIFGSGSYLVMNKNG